MKLTAFSVCVLLIVASFGMLRASPVENFFQKGKGIFFGMMGGDSNPFVAMSQQAMDAFGFDDWQEKMHDTFSDAIDSATSEEFRKQMEDAMSMFDNMVNQGKKKDEIKNKMKEALAKMQEEEEKRKQGK